MLCSPEKDRRIKDAFLSSPYARLTSFFVYLSFGSEADTRELIAALRAAGKRVCAPQTEGGEMRCVPLTDKTRRNAFGIEEPCGEGDFVCAAAVTPLLSFDRDGYRLGYGGGYYDVYFAKHPQVLRVGIAYAGQVSSLLPRGDGDVPLDAVVTEEGVRIFRRGANA